MAGGRKTNLACRQAGSIQDSENVASSHMAPYHCYIKSKKGVGKALMDAAEKHLKAQKCDFARVGCFSPNTGAHSFYEKCGYADRFVEMLKKL